VIHDVKDVTALLDRRFGSATSGVLSMLRVIVWTLVGFIVLGVLVPAPKVDLNKTHYNKIMPTRAVRDLTLDKNDPRGWKHPKRDPDAFTIAWVGSSTLQNVGRHYSFIPADVRERLPEIDGRPVRVEMYLLEGGRLMDLFNSVAEALSTKPDLVMVDLNPLWLFNDRQIQEWDNLNGVVFGNLIGDPVNWPLIAALDTPRDAALGAASSRLPVLRDRWSYAIGLRHRLDELSPLNPAVPDPTAPHVAPTGLALVATMQSPLAFWNYYRPLVPQGTPNRKLQEALLRGAKTDGSVMNDDIVAAMMNALGDSKIPAVAYIPPIEPSALSHAGVDPALRRIERHLQEIAAEHPSPTLLVKSQSAVRVLNGLTFKDLVHLTYDPPMIDYLVGLICSHLAATEPTAQCTPVSRAATP
jgi:hypothetical protein